MSEITKNPNSYDVIESLDDELRRAIGFRDYYVLGGIASQAIVDETTEFDHESRMMKVADTCELPVMRDNGTRRDIDILIADILREGEADKIRQRASEAVDGQLVVSVFGFDGHRSMRGSFNLLATNLGSFISKRTIDAGGTMRQELYPLSQELSPESMQPYRLQLHNGSSEVSVLSPAGHVLAYKMRSISGVRHKDREKVAKMEAAVNSDPYLQAQIEEGDFKPWREFAEAIDRLGHGEIDERDMKLKDTDVSLKGLAMFWAKARLLGWAESRESLIKLAQSDLGGKVLSPFTGNK